MRYGIEHPVVNDASFAVWQAYVVRAWPTAILIDPEGRVIASHSRRGASGNAFADLLADAVVEYDARDAIDRTPVSLALERNKAPDTVLSFPWQGFGRRKPKAAVHCRHGPSSDRRR